MKTTTKLFLVLIIATFSLSTNAQESVLEEDMPFTVLKWFYDHYPNTENAIWRKEESQGEIIYTASFKFEDQNFKTTYNSNGIRVEELMYLDSAPINLTNFLHDRFGQFKLKKIAKKTIFPSEETSYIAKIKSKEEGMNEIEYDDSSSTMINQVAVSDN